MNGKGDRLEQRLVRIDEMNRGTRILTLGPGSSQTLNRDSETQDFLSEILPVQHLAHGTIN